MPDTLCARVTEATGLVRAGDLGAATALIQRALGRRQPETSSAAPPQALVIEGAAIRLDPAPAAARASDAEADRPRTPPEAAPSRAPISRARPRTGLGQTLRDLALRRSAEAFSPDRPGRAPAPLPEGASFEALSHRGADIKLDYRLYKPSGRAGLRLPLVVMLHGCTQTPEDFAAGTRMNQLAEAEGFLVAYPAQSPAANPNRCWNWFRPEHQGRGRGEPEAIAGMVRDILRDRPADPRRVFVAGLSAGGATAAVMGAAYPDLFAAVGVHSGLASGAASDVVTAFAAMRRAPGARPVERPIPTIVFHGDSDATVHSSNGHDLVAQITAGADTLRANEMRGRSAAGRDWTRVAYVDSSGRTLCENWSLHGGGHAWSGGDAAGSYTDPDGPDASAEMLRFFLAAARGA